MVDFMWAPKGLTGVERWRRFMGWVPPELEQYAIDKSKRKSATSRRSTRQRCRSRLPTPATGRGRDLS